MSRNSVSAVLPCDIDLSASFQCHYKSRDERVKCLHRKLSIDTKPIRMMMLMIKRRRKQSNQNNAKWNSIWKFTCHSSLALSNFRIYVHHTENSQFGALSEKKKKISFVKNVSNGYQVYWAKLIVKVNRWQEESEMRANIFSMYLYIYTHCFVYFIANNVCCFVSASFFSSQIAIWNSQHISLGGTFFLHTFDFVPFFVAQSDFLSAICTQLNDERKIQFVSSYRHIDDWLRHVKKYTLSPIRLTR